MFDYFDSLSPQKKNLKVVIFGPYKEGGHKRLEELRDYLRNMGYSWTDIVENLPDPPQTNEKSDKIFATLKSEYWVRMCEVGLYVFFKNIPHGSVTVEVKELADNASNRIKCASFFLETGEKLETLEEGTIRKFDKDIAIFDTDKDLYILAEKACLHHMIEDNCSQFV